MGKPKSGKGKLGGGKGAGDKDSVEELRALKTVKFGKELGSPKRGGDGGTPTMGLCMHALGKEFGVGLGCKRIPCPFAHKFKGLKKAELLLAVTECPNAGFDKVKLRLAISRSTKF